MLVILKIPVAYVGWVIWWAIKAEPEIGTEGGTEGVNWQPWRRSPSGSPARSAPGRPARRPCSRHAPRGPAATSARKEQAHEQQRRGADTAAVVLLAIGLVASVVELFYRPFGIAPIGFLAVLIAAGLSARHRRLGLSASRARQPVLPDRRLDRRLAVEPALLTGGQSSAAAAARYRARPTTCPLERR